MTQVVLIRPGATVYDEQNRVQGILDIPLSDLADIWLTDVGRSTAFPSGHATQSLGTFMALALVGAAWLSKPRAPAVALATLLAAGVGCSRVYLGVHWTTDVLAGWLIAAAWIAAVASLAGAAARRRQ